ncbi:tRNA (guanine-N(7)-)-methyltransferase non-catalytic subunit wdr4-like [Stegastes partitus]|uniref:tRNA (Guanine-N(7)-)-methyltransferase non-catalytic subunit WDR4 n=1 Tax=Stegastes partitus TaxID=144197 RepID=A0A9Y4JRP3_9TELE|nr:PREDICTED: tRNA (guanine-N(7)-)-methyltransferase non-catalytic subunit WDR4 [Stegastes partitus]XP_008277659.1 PREDICTED: tRNA (guanine-N(7)-)-methyltransferase non-catalytic subunit wdr4-like [Stegastes partitus]
MAAAAFCGDWFVFTCNKKLVAIHSKDARERFVFDCSTAEKKPKDDNNSQGGATEETGSDTVLAFAVSPSGKLVALTDDTKRLVLFSCEPSWRCVSIMWVVRRCTSLVFSQAEDELLVADKSGDVYSFSVVEPQRGGKLKMGHLSMLLAVTISPDNKYIITADRDEKIRVSHYGSPYNIQSFCLGHQQFVSALHIPSGHPHWLLSGSGDGTVKLWEYESGRRLQSWDLGQFGQTQNSEADKAKNPAVCRIISSPDGHHVAVQCERMSTVQFFTLHQEGEESLVPHSRLSLPHCPLDMTFDMEGQLWVVMDSDDAPLQIYTLRQSTWECDTKNPNLNRVTETFRPHWESLEASTRTNHRFEHLYKVGYDNVTEYLQKKQQRLEEQQLKRTMAQKANGNKKAKKEASGAVTGPPV